MLVFFLFILLFFKKRILNIFSIIIKKDVILLEFFFRFIIKILILVIFIYYFNNIVYILKVDIYLIKELILELTSFKETDNIIIDPDKPLQGIDQLDESYRKHYLNFFLLLYILLKE